MTQKKKPKVYITRRKLDAGCLEFKEEQKATGNSRRQEVVVKQGLDQKLAKQLRPGMSVIVRVDTRSKPMD